MSFIESLIYKNENAISKFLCDEIITMFEVQDNKFDGTTLGGVNKDIKDTTDFIIPRNTNDIILKQKWEKIDKFLEKELNRNVKLYIDELQKFTFNNITEDHTNRQFCILDSNFVGTTEFMIQRYLQNKGKYIYHNDFRIDWDQKKHRVITYLFYLNDVEEGGETEFWGSYKIKPKAGTLILFPASWQFPHRGIMPKSSNKYIITGWLYVLHNK